LNHDQTVFLERIRQSLWFCGVTKGGKLGTPAMAKRQPAKTTRNKKKQDLTHFGPEKDRLFRSVHGTIDPPRPAIADKNGLNLAKSHNKSI